MDFLFGTTSCLIDEGDNGSLMGAYLHHDPVSLKYIIRSGSAANDDGQASKNDTLSDIKSWFYICHPSKVGGHRDKDLRWGHFDDLIHYVALGFSLSNGVDNLEREKDGVFVWSERTLNTLKATHMGGATMKTKKLVLIAYLFEIYYDLLITRKNNVSHSFGLERSIGAFDTI